MRQLLVSSVDLQSFNIYHLFITLLHWLSILCRIDFKLFTRICSAINLYHAIDNPTTVMSLGLTGSGDWLFWILLLYCFMFPFRWKYWIFVFKCTFAAFALFFWFAAGLYKMFFWSVNGLNLARFLSGMFHLLQQRLWVETNKLKWQSPCSCLIC